MRTVGFGLGEASELLRALAAILHLGEVAFAVPNSESYAIQAPEGALATACRLLGVAEEDLEAALRRREIQRPGEQAVRANNTVWQAQESRDAMARRLRRRQRQLAVMFESRR